MEASWFHDPNTSRLLHLSSDSWRAHSLIPTRRSGRRRKFHYSSTSCLPPVRRLVCTVLVQAPSCIFMDGYMEAYSTPSVPTSHSSLSYYFQQLPLSAQWALRHLEFEGNLQLLRRSLSLGTALAVSDGSFISPFSTASWTITNQSDSMSGLCCVPGIDK